MSNAIADAWKQVPGPVKIGLGVVVGVLVYKKAKAFINRPPHIPLPNGGYGLPVTGTDASGNAVLWSPDSLATELYNVMSGGGTFSGTKDEAWLKLYNLPTADMITHVYNKFNSQYGAGDSLTTWIDDEYYYDYLSGVKSMVLGKLRGLNLN